MSRKEILDNLSEHSGDLRRFGVKSIAVFGSVARNEAASNSDIDLLVELDPEERIGILRFLELKEYLEHILSSKVDLVTREGLKQQLKEEILREAVSVS